MQNVVSLGAVKVTSNPNIASIAPEKRKCYFDYEYPLSGHQKYSQVKSLWLMEHILHHPKYYLTGVLFSWVSHEHSPVKNEQRREVHPMVLSISWPCNKAVFTLWGQGLQPSPWQYISWWLQGDDKIHEQEIYLLWRGVTLFIISQQCLPDCDETLYTASVSAAPFRQCDFKNLGMNPMCDLDRSDPRATGFADVNPPMWGESVLEQYKLVYKDVISIRSYN